MKLNEILSLCLDRQRLTRLEHLEDGEPTHAEQAHLQKIEKHLQGVTEACSEFRRDQRTSWGFVVEISFASTLVKVKVIVRQESIGSNDLML